MVSSAGAFTPWLPCGPPVGSGIGAGDGGSPALCWTVVLVAVSQACLGGPFHMALCLRRKDLSFPVTIRLRKSLCPIVPGASLPCRPVANPVPCHTTANSHFTKV